MTAAERSEDVSRRALAALVVGASGPIVQLTIVYLLAGPVLGSTIESPDVGGVLVGVLLGGMVLDLVSMSVGAIAIGAAFVLTRARWPLLGWLASMVLMPVWIVVVESMPIASLPAYLAMLGVLPGTIRLLLPTRPRAGSTEVSPLATAP